MEEIFAVDIKSIQLGEMPQERDVNFMREVFCGILRGKNEFNFEEIYRHSYRMTNEGFGGVLLELILRNFEAVLQHQLREERDAFIRTHHLQRIYLLLKAGKELVRKLKPMYMYVDRVYSVPCRGFSIEEMLRIILTAKVDDFFKKFLTEEASSDEDAGKISDSSFLVTEKIDEFSRFVNEEGIEQAHTCKDAARLISDQLRSLYTPTADLLAKKMMVKKALPENFYRWLLKNIGLFGVRKLDFNILDDPSMEVIISEAESWKESVSHCLAEISSFLSGAKMAKAVDEAAEDAVCEFIKNVDKEKLFSDDEIFWNEKLLISDCKPQLSKNISFFRYRRDYAHLLVFWVDQRIKALVSSSAVASPNELLQAAERFFCFCRNYQKMKENSGVFNEYVERYLNMCTQFLVKSRVLMAARLFAYTIGSFDPKRCQSLWISQFYDLLKASKYFKEAFGEIVIWFLISKLKEFNSEKDIEKALEERLKDFGFSSSEVSLLCYRGLCGSLVDEASLSNDVLEKPIYKLENISRVYEIWEAPVKHESFSVVVMNSPLIHRRIGGIEELIFPELRSTLKKHLEHYQQHHPSKAVNWTNFGRVELLYSKGKSPMTIICSPLQAHLLRDLSSGRRLSVNETVQISGVSLHERAALFHSVCDEQSIIKCTTHDGKPIRSWMDYFKSKSRFEKPAFICLNKHFLKDPPSRIDLLSKMLKPWLMAFPSTNLETRRFDVSNFSLDSRVDANIVLALRLRRSMGEAELIDEVLTKLSDRFELAAQQIAERLNLLESKGYLNKSKDKLGEIVWKTLV